MQIKTQKNLKDCGLVCLQAIYHHYFFKWLTLENLRSKCNITEKGISIADLVNVASQNNLLLEAYKVSVDQLFYDQLDFPVLTLIRNDQGNLHYVIIEKTKKEYVKIIDPFFGKKNLKKSNFQKIYEGVLITVKPIDYKLNSKLKSSEHLISKIIKWNKNWLFCLALCAILTSIFLLTSSIYAKALLDDIIPSYKENQLVVITLIFSIFAIFRGFNILFSSLIKNRLKLRIFIQLAQLFVEKTHSMPILESNKFEITDKIKRVESIIFISSYITDFLELVFVSLIIGITSIITMLVISVQLAMILFFILLIIFILTFFQKSLLLKKSKTLLINSLEFNRSIYELINSSPDFKRKDFHSLVNKKFQLSLSKNIDGQLDLIDFSSFFSLIKNTIFFICPLIIYFLSAKLIMNNQMQIGSMILFVSMFSFLASSIENFSNLIASYSEFKNHFEFLTSYIFINSEILNKNGYVIPTLKSIKLENFTFNYSISKNILKINNFIFKNHVHLTGTNGSGKSTLLKILAGLFNLDNIYINDVELKLLNLDEYRKNIILIDNRNFMPTMKIIDYITDGIESRAKVLLENLEFYKLAPILIQSKINLLDQINNNGESLSSGQKQLINILKIFTKKYQLVLLDEAFSNISWNIRQKVILAIFDFQKTSIIVATTHNNERLPIKEKVYLNEINYIQ